MGVVLGVEVDGLRAATAVGRTTGRCCPVELGRVVVGFDSHCSSAFSADVVVLVSARENEQELRPYRRRSTTLGAEQAGRLKLSEALLPGHRLKFYTGAETTGTLTAPLLVPQGEVVGDGEGGRRRCQSRNLEGRNRRSGSPRTRGAGYLGPIVLKLFPMLPSG